MPFRQRIRRTLHVMRIEQTLPLSEEGTTIVSKLQTPAWSYLQVVTRACLFSSVTMQGSHGSQTLFILRLHDKMLCTVPLLILSRSLMSRIVILVSSKTSVSTEEILQTDLNQHRLWQTHFRQIKHLGHLYTSDRHTDACFIKLMTLMYKFCLLQYFPANFIDISVSKTYYVFVINQQYGHYIDGYRKVTVKIK